MIQTGDPSGSGKGGQSLWGSPFADEIRSTLKVPWRRLRMFLALIMLLSFKQFNNRGILAMANSGPDTNKSQFFITYAKQPHLDGKYTIFGKVLLSKLSCVPLCSLSLLACPGNRRSRLDP